METVIDLTQLDDRASAGGGCENVDSTKTRFGLAMVKGNRLLLQLKGADYKSYERPAIPCGIEAWCLEEGNLTDRTERSMANAMCAVQHKDRKEPRI